MEKLQKQIQQAHRRMIVQQFLRRLVWCLFWGLVAAVVAIAVPKFLPLPGLPQPWDLLALAIGTGTAALFALGWTFLSQRSELEAAIEIDRRFGLRERVASSFSLTEEDLQSAFGQALLQDTARRLERIDIRERFGVKMEPRGWLPLVPAMIALGLMFLVNDRTAEALAKQADVVAQQEQVKTTAEDLKKKLADKKKQAEAQGLKEAERLLKKLEKSVEDLEKKPTSNKKEATLKLNDLAEELKKRQRELGGRQGLEKQFEQLKKLTQGPADKLANALKKGDVSKALEELKKLQKQMANDQMSDEAKEKLQKQLAEMQRKLNAAADAHKKAQQDLQQKLAEAQRKNDPQQAQKIQQQLNKLSQSQSSMNDMQKMAEKLGQCQQCMKSGDKQGAAQAMSELADQLAQLQQEMNEMEMLDQMMEQISQTKMSMNCSQCSGSGCAACQGGLFASNKMGQSQGKGQGKGNGMGEGQGRGPRPDAENDVNFRDSQVRAKPEPGRSVVTGRVEGPNQKGSVRETIKEAMAVEASQAADALTRQRLPRAQREHAEEYFNSLREP